MTDMIIGQGNKEVLEQKKSLIMPDGTEKDVAPSGEEDVIINAQDFENWVREYNKMKKKVEVMGDMYAGIYDALRTELKMLQRDELTLSERGIKQRLEQVVDITDEIMEKCPK